MQPLPGARHHEGPDCVRTNGDQTKAESLIKLLNDALAREIISLLRYWYQYFMSAGICARHRQAQFLGHVVEVQGHADQLAERIVQLGGRPDVFPERLMSRTRAGYVKVDSVGRMFAGDLFAERIAIEHYRAMTVSLGVADLTTQQIVEMILAQEESHAESLVSLARDGTSERDLRHRVA